VFDLTITIPNDGDLDAILAKLYGLLGDPTPILDEASAVILARMRRNFLQEQGPDGLHWIPSQAALDRKKSGKGGGTLFDTGRLFRSIQLHSINPTERAISTDVPYGGFHQYGTVKLPKRTFLGFNEEDAQVAQGVALKLFTQAVQ
jgi:phage virion morphogenesis protein